MMGSLFLDATRKAGGERDHDDKRTSSTRPDREAHQGKGPAASKAPEVAGTGTTHVFHAFHVFHVFHALSGQPDLQMA
jgi:hypothetical protein